VVQRCHFTKHAVPTLCEGAAMGSEKAKKGRAKFMKPFLNDSSFLCPWIILMSSRHTRPTTAAVVVAMAGMILPAISLLCIGERTKLNYCFKELHLQPDNIKLKNSTQSHEKQFPTLCLSAGGMS